MFKRPQKWSEWGEQGEPGRRVGGDVREIQARVGRILQVSVRVWPSRINKMVAIAVPGKEVAESDQSPSRSLCSENKGWFFGCHIILLHWKPLQASGSHQMTYRPSPSWPGRAW